MVRHNYIGFSGIQLLLLLFAVTAARAASTLAAYQSDGQVDSYCADNGLVTVAATGLAVILLGGLALVGSALRRREAWQADQPEGWRAELMEFLEDDLANFAAGMQGVPSQPERSRSIRSRPARLGAGYSRQYPDGENRDGRAIDAIPSADGKKAS
jgi:hypothetical protein